MKAAIGSQGEARRLDSKPGFGPPGARGFDLMRVRAIRSLVLWTGFPRAIQWVLLGAFVAVIVIAWGALTPRGVNDKLYAKTHLATLVVWGIWWPAMVWTTVWFGRAWCAVCPLELLGSMGERLARSVGLPGRPLPRSIASGALILALYGLIQLLVMGVHLHRIPAYTSVFLIGLVALAVVAGLVFRDRAMCRGFCPIGLLLGTYGRGGMLAVRPGLKTAENAGAGPDARACPSLLNPSGLDTNADCLGCAHCFRRAAPGSMRLLLRRPFAGSDRRESFASWPITGFVMIVSGFVTSELCSEWPVAKKIFAAPPQWATAQLGWSGGGGWIEGLWTLGVVPAIVWLVLGAVLCLAGEQAPWPQRWRRLALPVAVVVAAAHMSKGLAKLVSWIPFLPGAWRDPSGVDTARAITQQAVPAAAALVSLSTVAWIGIGLVSASFFLAVREYRLAGRGDAGAMRGAWPLGLLATCFAALIFGWRYA